ncbi:MAG: tetratricopeptide repeat protein [Candidatus Hydrogenedentes bacterium]|nr:tetratricopeptide repeat protein [Candidatus Hydrogenedentota bacterium]
MNEYLGIALAVVLMAGGLAAKWSTGYRARKAWRLGCEAFEAEDLSGAERQFRRCVKLVPIWTVTRRMLGRALARQGRFGEAEEQFRFAAQLEPRNGEGYLDLGFFLASCPPNRPDEALEMFSKALEYTPSLREALAGAEQLGPLREDSRFLELLAKSN